MTPRVSERRIPIYFILSVFMGQSMVSQDGGNKAREYEQERGGNTNGW